MTEFIASGRITLDGVQFIIDAADLAAARVEIAELERNAEIAAMALVLANDRIEALVNRCREMEGERAEAWKDAALCQEDRNKWRNLWGESDQENSNLKAHVRRLTGCLLVIAGTSSRIGGGSIRTAAGEAALMGASVEDIGRKLENPVVAMVESRRDEEPAP